MTLLSKRQQPDARGCIQQITPQTAGWHYVGFAAYQLNQGQRLTLESHDNELCLVLVAGLASVKTRQGEFPRIGKRLSPFERTPPWSVYVPPGDCVEVLADTNLELAVCSAPATGGGLPARLIAADDVGIEQRGKGRNKRLVHNILPDSQPADCLLVVEVYTDEGDTSSYPSHKHDQKHSADETYLEETYYHRFDPPQGFAMQRVYTDDRSLDECMAAYNQDVVMVPRGYHPVATMAGYDNYYLNVMAGPVRRWKFTWEKDHVWVNSDSYPRR
ncbi:5-deoxy-glucuronate isomerase [Erwinia sp. OLTSP20]|uniref:5-deoxy-glucuronate isomerase n=1 Tax=unclassified Erwinia TaxID=2622719 RepID=UPI000C187E86|nr:MULTISPECIES: 5-deoxy-glucuronate isomerase [unclassified Erwinia]PIJ51137.1 5-deoxy-glucuronate isomerase [Erwinia sp. OAMSP11]PIJ73889.1 5-deoxy-glucuronate isomerase [Erwinia sp. OLSSP12]PIJ83897.1 5-deoxy-glucuronate isomerase [Erwinia sp. OLCASP19]PIJ86427.1 5-deoxy-glucuronate isomerase [Erwinia sp. OLMTSP26]PIJ87906.1 5-deoxy-glucuronate isomerase [Erwinia sp. OLMDSP33]